jgi:hypothetical protein
LKLRIRDNSIRLRLSQSEVEQVGESGRVAGNVKFGGGSRFEYALHSSTESGDCKATISSNRLTVSVPESAINRWSNSEDVSISAQQPLGDEGHLSILIEKDFTCLAPREGEDESDMYPHPESAKADC